MAQKILREKYKTRKGAAKRAAFENGIAKSQYDRGHARKRYHFFITAEGQFWRVARDLAKDTTT